MVFDKSFHRGGEDARDAYATALRDSAQLRLARGREAADEAGGQVRAAVAHQRSLEKAGEVAFNQSVHIRVAAMLEDPRCKSAEISGRGGFLIYLANDSHIIDVESGSELRSQRLGDQVLDEIGDEEPSQARSTALVSKDESAGPDAMHYAGAVEQAAVGACSERPQAARAAASMSEAPSTGTPSKAEDRMPTALAAGSDPSISPAA